MGLRTRLVHWLAQGNELASLRQSTAVPPASSENPTRNRDSLTFEVNGWETSAFVLQKLVPLTGVHPFPLHELLLMTAAVCNLQPKVIFEWGTNIGKSARIFHEISLQYGLGTSIHSIDLPDDVEHVEHPHDQRGWMVRGINDVHLHQGDGLSTSLSIWSEEGKPQPALFFIDGDHSYESVHHELLSIVAAVPKPNVRVQGS